MKKLYIWILFFIVVSNSLSYGLPRIKIDRTKVSSKILKRLVKGNKSLRESLQAIKKNTFDTRRYAKIGSYCSCLVVGFYIGEIISDIRKI